MTPPHRETNMITKFLTFEYAWKNGDTPLGCGHWVFCTEDDFNSKAKGCNSFLFVGTYSAAKKAAMQHYPAGSVVVVMP